MKLKTLALLVLGLTIPAVCSAQSLKSGTWTGTVVPPEGDTTSVTFDVTVNGDSLGIVIHAGEHGDFITQQGHYADGKISFIFTPGPQVTCVLSRNEEGAFSGGCVEEDGSVAQVTMVPPGD